MRPSTEYTRVPTAPRLLTRTPALQAASLTTIGYRLMMVRTRAIYQTKRLPRRDSRNYETKKLPDQGAFLGIKKPARFVDRPGGKEEESATYQVMMIFVPS